MVKSNGGRSSLRLELRRRFPHIDFKWFLEIVDIIGFEDIETLTQELEKEEAKAVRAEEERKARLAALVKEINVSEKHRQIFIATGEADLEHSQAILAYGFAMPGSQRSFVGSRSLPLRHVRSNVERKLLAVFDEHRFRAAWDFLLANGVVAVHVKGRGEAYSLNIDTHKRGVTGQGKAIIQEMKVFLRKK